MILVPLFDLKFLDNIAAGVQELQIGGTNPGEEPGPLAFR
jgi:hypothetical protein